MNRVCTVYVLTLACVLTITGLVVQVEEVDLEACMTTMCRMISYIL